MAHISSLRKSCFWDWNCDNELSKEPGHLQPWYWPSSLGIVQSSGMILCMHPANEIQRYNVMQSFIGWGHTQNRHWGLMHCPLWHSYLSAIFIGISELGHHWISIASDNGLVPTGTKPLSEAILTYHQSVILEDISVKCFSICIFIQRNSLATVTYKVSTC